MCSRNKGIIRWVFVALVLFCMLAIMGCQLQKGSQSKRFPVHVTAEVERLSKLCRVWGYVKYTHPAFLLGQKDWDEELLALVPQVRELETHEEVNALLHEWFVGLGAIDYGTSRPVKLWAEAEEEDKVVVADTSWTIDAAYLGEDLADDLGQLTVIPMVRRTHAPVRPELTISDLNAWHEEGFGNETEPEGSCEDAGFRLLGLFRLWNAVEYYFPYLALMDRDWEDCLAEYIPLMLEGTDHWSYEQTLAACSAHLHDYHVFLSGGSLLDRVLGQYLLPASWTDAEGKLVVSDAAADSPLEQGDVILRINGVDIDEIAKERGRYYAWPREEAILRLYLTSVPLSETPDMEVAVLRDGQEISASVKGETRKEYMAQGWVESPDASHRILEGNIGLINPGVTPEGGAAAVMAELQDTEGLIVDMRQYPDMAWFSLLPEFLIEDAQPAIVVSSPSVAVPGAYVKKEVQRGYSSNYAPYNVYHYDKPVVLLIDTGTVSRGEYVATICSIGERVVTMGENTTGADGNVVGLPLPGGLRLSFSSEGIYMVDGQLTQRTGLTPDIPVSRTVQGIREGRDELMEAAVQYIIDNQ